MFEFFSDENLSIRNALESINSRFNCWNACVLHRYGNVKKYFGKKGADAYKDLALCYTTSQFRHYLQVLKEISSTTRSLHNRKFTLVQYALKMMDNDMRCIILEGNVPSTRFGYSSTGSVEGLNSKPGASRSPWSRGYLRYLHGVWSVMGYYLWYIHKIRNDHLQAKHKAKQQELLTSMANKVFEKRWKASEKVVIVHETTGTTLGLGNSMQVFSCSENGLTYKVVLNALHEHRYHRGSCTCNMFQEHCFPCKHAMFVIKHRCSGDKKKAKEFMIDKCLLDKRFTLQSYLEMFEKMELYKYKIPDISYISNLAKQTDLFTIPQCERLLNPDRTIQTCACGFCDGKQKTRKPGRKKIKRLVSSKKSKNDC